ncbi:MAG TPA: hypothetical protein VLZ75_07410 [Chitinophagales bacterium]|nr:hypothetical protein [Chitinophagales bacterium]
MTRWFFSFMCFVAFSSTVCANTDIILRSPRQFEEVIPPVTLMWNLSGQTSDISLIRIEVYETNEQMNPIGPPVWATSLFNIWQNQVFVDYSEWVTCKQYGWRVTLYKNSSKRLRGEYFENNSAYTKILSSQLPVFKINCSNLELEQIESTGYFDFSNESTPYVFSQRWGSDIKFHYFSPYENDQIECKIYNWEREVIASTFFSLQKGSNYLDWTELFSGIEGEIELSEVYFLEVVNGKDLKKALKFNWVDE